MLRVLAFLSGIAVSSVMGQSQDGQADAVVDAVVDAVGIPEESTTESTDQSLTEGEGSPGSPVQQRATTADIKVPETSLAQNSEGEASGLVSGEANVKVESRLSLKDKIQNRLAQIKAKKAEVEATDEYREQQKAAALKGKKAKVMAARDNLLDSAHLHGVFHSLFQKDEKDAYMDAAVKKAAKDMSGKGRTKVTLEERIAQIDNVEHAMETQVSSELSGIFADLMGRHKKCTQCSRDCPAMRWSEYGVHTLAECDQYCKLIVCKEWDDPHKPYEQEVARFEEERKERANNPKYAKSTVFQNYLPDYLREYGPESLVVNDEGEYELSWDFPPEKKQPWEMHNDEDVHPDVMESLRELPALPGKSAEDVLKEIARQEEAEKLVPAFETNQLEDKSVMYTRKDLDRELKTQVRDSGKTQPELL